MKERTLYGHRGIAASSEALSSQSPVIIRTWQGYEIWLDSAADPSERTGDGDLVFRFAVTSPQREFAIIRAEIPAEVQDAARAAVGPRFIDEESLWHGLAHDALAEALDEHPLVFHLGTLYAGSCSIRNSSTSHGAGASCGKNPTELFGPATVTTEDSCGTVSNPRVRIE